jgi:hypothetical protein
MKTSFDARILIHRRWWVVLVTLTLLVPTAWGISRLTTTSDTRVFFSAANPHLQALEEFEQVYSKDESAFIVLAPRDGTVFTRDALAAIEELTDSAWQLPYSRRVDSLANFQHTWAQEDDLVVEDLVENASDLSNADIQRIQTIALSEPLLVNRLVSATGHVTGIYVTTSKPGLASEENTEIALAVRRLADEFRRAHPDIAVYLTGGVMLDQGFTEATERDMATLIPIMFGVMVVTIALLVGSISGTLATLVVIVASALTALGLAGWSGLVMTPATGVAPVIILTLAVADSIHILTRVFQEMRHGNTKEQAIVESLRVNLQPVFLTSATTVLGFLTMNFSDVPPFRQLGNVVAGGVTAAFVFSIVLLPALLAILPVRIKTSADAGHVAHLYCGHAARRVVAWRRPLLWTAAALVLVLAGGLGRIEIADNFIKYFDESYTIRADSDFVSDNLTGLDIMEYSLDSGEEGGISDPAYLAHVDAFSEWYRQQPGVTQVNALPDTMKRLNRSMHGDHPAHYAIPRNRELAAQYLLLYEMSLPFGLDLNSRINLDKSASRFTAVLNVPATIDQLALEDRANRWLAEHPPRGSASTGTGLTLIWAHITERNIRSMLTSVTVALLLISVVLIVALRSVKIGLISLLPNLLPAILGFGLWGLLVGRINLGVSVVAAMSLGIVVDDTVHFLTKYLRARREKKMNAREGVCYAFSTVGLAMITTSVSLIAGFLVLTFSGFGMNAAMGLLTAIVVAFALVADLLFLPPLLMTLDRR